MAKNTRKNRMRALFMALSVLAGSSAAQCGSVFAETYYGTYGGYFGLENTALADTGSRIKVDINANDGRKASFDRTADNWCVPGGSSAEVTLSGLTYKLSNGGGASGDIRSVNYKVLQKMSGIYPYLTMDGVTIDNSSGGGIIKLEISGLSAGTHSLKTWHSCVDNATVGTMSVTINGTKTASGISCPTRVTDSDNAGISYSTFNVSAGQTVTVLISPEGSGNAWLNAFEIDGGDPFNGISDISPSDQESHHLRENGLSWTAGKNAKSHDVYIGTDYSTVFNADTNSSVYKGNQTGTTYALDETYQSVNTYYWRVDTIDNSGNVIKGAVNSFNVARLAFPTAEGYGRYARGGQGGVVLHVTNLKDDGSEGSLRWALCDEKWLTEDWKGVPRIVVFDVGGVIELQDTLCIPDNGGSVYIAGQTAPGDGITLIKHDFGAMGSTDVIIRDVRVRVGEENGVSTGGMGLSSCNNTIVDHCSISWATDEGFSSRQAQNITFQWNIIGETLNNSVHYLDSDRTQTERHSFAASIGGYTGSYHHNLLINNTGRNWSLAGALEQDGATYGGQADIRNNVVYNWRDRTTDGGVRRLNFVNNYYKAGAVSNTSLHVVSIDGNELGSNDMQKMYVSGNVMTNTDGSYILKSTDDAWSAGKAISGGKGGATVSDVKSTSPFFDSYVETQSADDAYKSVIAAAGAGGTSSTGWDYIDSRYIKEVTNGTYTLTGSRDGLKGIIDSHEDAGGYPTSSEFAHSTDGVTNSTNDTDRDGIPNAWETEHGLNPNDASDGAICTLSADGYTNVEMFLNELCGDPVDFNGTSVKKGAVMDTTVSYVFENVNSGLYLQVDDAAAESGAVVVQGTTAGAYGWKLKDAGEGYYYIYSEVGDGTTYCLDLPYGSTDNGTQMGIWTNDESDARKFKFVESGNGSYTIYTKSTEDKSCLGVASASKDEDASVVQWSSNNSNDQKWYAYVKVSGNLISELILKDKDYYSSWSIDDSSATGDLVYGDRDATYTQLPEELVGAETIVTACDSKNSTGTLAEFKPSTDVIAYVALDVRVETPPAWLSDWTLTEMTAVNSKDVTFNIYQKSVAAGETVTLGENGQSATCVNYTVFVAEDESKNTTTTTTTTATTTTTTLTSIDQTGLIYGDANDNNVVEVADAVFILQGIADPSNSEFDFTERGELQANCNKPDTTGVDAQDALSIQSFMADMIDSLPEL